MCRKYARPSNPNTTPQQTQRFKFDSAVKAWQALNSASQDVWRANATGLVMTGYNLFIRNYLLWQTSDAPLVISNIQNWRITTFRATTGSGWFHQLVWYPSFNSAVRIQDNRGSLIIDDASEPIPTRLRLQIVQQFQTINIFAGDTLELTFNGGAFMKIYLPAISGGSPVFLYPSMNGSTYYNDAMTSLAYASP